MNRDSGELKTSLGGKGIYPHESARMLLNPLRNLILSPRRLIERLALETDMTVLEVGCGPGFFSRAVASAIPDGRLLMFDIQPEMLTMAAGRMHKAHLANFETWCGNAKKLPFDDRSVDVAFMVTVLGEVEDGAACLAELHRVLKPDGRLSVTEMKGDPDYLDEELVRRMTGDAGFAHEHTFKGMLHFTLNATNAA